MAVATAANWIWCFLISFFTPMITAAIHLYYGFVFTGCLIFSFFYVYFFVYETKGLSLEEVDELYSLKYQHGNRPTGFHHLRIVWHIIPGSHPKRNLLMNKYNLNTSIFLMIITWHCIQVVFEVSQIYNFQFNVNIYHII